MTGHAKLRILICSGLVLAALCTIVVLRVARGTRTSPKPAVQTTHVASPIEVEPSAPAISPRPIEVAASSEHLRPHPDTGQQHKILHVERVVTPEQPFKRLPVHLSDIHGDFFDINPKWSGDFVRIDRQDLDQAGSLERALGRAPGIVFRQTDPP
jgi:hypothetical protein